MSNFARRMDSVWPLRSVDITQRETLLERPAMMVTYVATNPKACIRCLILRTQVFFSYEPKKYSFGYVWMRQNHGDLLSPCVSENVCTELWYDEKFEYLDISDDMRPWSVEDLGDVNI